ncbi:hypothetical protein [Aquiflexum lacus]|uniref:hypothetical protein n=1 Tax=Aquiflexum lacus TaxID=2483805 RepID=UPI001892FAE6|nr:hypothetical protein [Aquiflexum lacus]
MKTLQQVMVFSAIFCALGIFSSCEDKCEDTMFQIKELSMSPRTKSESSTSLTPWRISDELPYNRLMFIMQMPKPVSVFFTLNADCPAVWKNENRITDLKLVSDRDYNEEYPAGSDLLEIASFSVDQINSISKSQFLGNYVNQSEITTAYLTFNEAPLENAVHKLRLDAQTSDEKSIESAWINILLKPIE